MKNLRAPRFRAVAFSITEEQLTEAQTVARNLGLNFSQTVRRSLNIGLPVLKKTVKHAVGVERITSDE